MPSELQTPLDWTHVTVSVQIKLLYSSLGISANDVQLLTYYGFFCFSSSICRGVFCHCDIQAHISETKLQVMEISGLVQDCGNSRALALELLQSCTKPLRQSCWSCIYMLYMCNMQRCDKSEQESTPCSDHWFHSCSVSYHVHRDHWWISVYQAVALMSNKSEKDLCFLQSLKSKISEKREKQFRIPKFQRKERNNFGSCYCLFCEVQFLLICWASINVQELCWVVTNYNKSCYKMVHLLQNTKKWPPHGSHMSVRYGPLLFAVLCYTILA